jgi:hypothetical protein
MADPSVLDTPSLTNLSPESLTAPPTVSPRCTATASPGSHRCLPRAVERSGVPRLHRAAKQLERLTKDTPAWYSGTRAKVEARAALEQAEELRRVLEGLGER